MATNPNILPNDPIVDGLGDLSTNLTDANDGFKDFINQISSLSGSIKGLDKSVSRNANSVGTGLSDIANMTRVSAESLGRIRPQPQIRSNFVPQQPFIPDVGNFFPTDFRHPAMTSQTNPSFRSAQPTSIAGHIGQSYAADANKNLLQMGHTLNPLSFLQYSMMYGASFPVQMKMADTIVKPVTDVNQKFDQIKGFSTGFTGIGEAVNGFMGQLKSPFQMYEGLYQSKIMLSSALGGEKQSNTAVNNALKMAREYPVKTEQVLSSLSRLAVYPEVKPHLQNEDFQKKLMETVSGLSLIVPEQGMEGAMFSLVEAMSGSWRSMQMRFNISPEVIQSLSGMTKEEMSSDPSKLIGGLHTFIGKAVGLDVLEKQKYTFSKQVDNFGDSLQLLTKEVFEKTDLYKSITGGAAVFQTGFSSLAGNKEFTNYIGGIMQPYQTRLDSAFAKFSGVGIGSYKTMPMTQVLAAMEKNFEGLSMDEIGSKFEVLIDDIGGIWKDTNNAMNDILNSKMGTVLGKIGGDIASVAGKSFSGMVSAVLSGVKDSFLENPMNILAPIGYMVLPLGATLGVAQLIPTVIQKAFQGGSVSRGIGKMGSALYGASNTQAGDLLLQESKSRLQKSAKTGQLLDPEDLKNTDRIAGTKFTRVKSSNINSLMASYIDDLEKSTNKFRNSTVDKIGKDEENIIESRKGQGRSSRKMVEDTISKAYNLDELSPDEIGGLKKSREYLKSAGYSDEAISSIERTRSLETIGAIEDENQMNGKGRKLLPQDYLTLRNSNISPTYDYSMSKVAEEAIQKTQLKTNIQEPDFEIGNRITDRQLTALKNKSTAYGSLKGVETPEDFINKFNSNTSFGSKSMKEFSQTGRFDLDEFKSQASAYNDLKDVKSAEGFNRQVKLGKFTDEQLANFSKQSGLSVNDLKGLKPSELGGYYQKTPAMTDDVLKNLKTNPMSAEIFDILKTSEKLTRGIYSQTKNISDDIKSGKIVSSAPLAQEAVSMNPYIAQVKTLTNNIANLKELNGYDMSNMVSPKTANRMSRMLNMSGDELGGINIPVTDPTKVKALGTESINLMSAINTPEFKAYQKGGVEALSGMDVSGARKALQGQEAIRTLVETPDLVNTVAESMSKGGSRLKGYAALTKMGGKLGSSALGRGLTYAAGATMAAIDPLTIGYGVGELAHTMGASGKTSIALGAGAAGLTGAGLYGKYRGLMRSEALKLSEAGLASDAVGAAAKTNAGGLMSKSLTSVAGLGGGLAVAQTALSIATSKFQANKDIADFNKKSEDTINSYKGITDTEKSTLIKNTSNMTTPDSARSSGGIRALLENPQSTLGNLAMIAGGGALALSAPATGGLTGFAGLTAASIGATNLASTYYGGTAKPSDQVVGMQGIVNGIVNGTAYNDKRLAEYDKDINSLEFSKSLTKLSPEENAKLTQTKILRAKVADNKSIQLGQVSTVSDVYAIDNKGEFDAETGQTIQTAPLANTTSYKLNEYLKSGKQATGKGAISEYLGLTQIDVQSKAELNKEYDAAVKDNDVYKQKQIINRDAEINGEMGKRFNIAADNVDYKNADQVEIVRASETNRLKSMVVPYKDPEQMKQFKSLNQGNLLATSMNATIMGAASVDQNKRNMYSSVEVAANEKLAAIGITNPFEAFNQTQQQYLDKNMSKDKNTEGFANLGADARSKLSQAGISNIDDLMSKSSGEMQSIYSDKKLSTKQRSSVDAVISDGSVNKKASIEEYKNMQADIFKSIASTGTGKSGEDEFTKLSDQQSSFKNVDLSGFSKAEQTNIKSNIDRRGSAIETLQGTGKQFADLAFKTTGKEVKDLTSDDIQRVKETDEYKSINLDKFRMGIDTLSTSTVSLDKTFNVTKDTVEKGLNNSLEKASIAATNFHSGAMSKEDYMQQTPTIYGEMKNSIERLRATGTKSQSDAGTEFNKLISGNASLQNITQSMGVNTVGDLIKRDEEGVTGLSKIQASGFNDGASMAKLASLSEQYTTGQKSINDANMLGITTAQKNGQDSFQMGGAGSKEAEIAGGRVGFDFKNRKRLKDIVGQELKFYTDAYLNAGTKEEEQAALSGLQLTDQKANSLGITPGQRGKYIGSRDIDRAATSKMVDVARDRSLSAPQIMAIAGNNYKPIDKNIDQSKYTKGELAEYQMGGELPTKNVGKITSNETRQQYMWDDNANGGKGAPVQLNDLKDGEVYKAQQKQGVKQEDGIYRTGAYKDKEGNVINSEFNNTTGEFINSKSGEVDMTKMPTIESTILPKLDNNAVDSILQPLQLEAIVTPKMDSNALQNTQLSVGSEQMLGGETNNVAELSKGLDGVVGSLGDFNNGFAPQSESGGTSTGQADQLTGSIGSDLTIPNPKQWADTIASAVSAPLSTVSNNMTDRNNTFAATAISSEATEKVMNTSDAFDKYTKSIDTGDGALNSQQIATQGAITDGLINGMTIGLEVPKNDPSIRFDIL